MRNYHGFWVVALCTLGDAHAASITVNTAVDEFGAGASCSLREAIQSANNNANFGGCIATGIYVGAITDVITLPSATFTLTREATDDNNDSGDLDIDSNLRIEGVSATNSVIRGDINENDVAKRHRVIHIISGNVVLNDLTLRNGIENGSTAAGGLRISDNDSIVTLNSVTVTANSAGGNAGGILNRGTLNINDSLISNNETVNSDDGGGGIFNSLGGTLTINDSRILNNTVNSALGGTASGGGIYNDIGATLTLNNSVVDGNLADGRSGDGEQDAFGGGIYTDNDPLAASVVTLVQSSVTDNEALGRYSHGGGIYSESSDAILVDRSVVSFNTAESDEIVDGRAFGGGIEALAGSVTIQDSVISGNQALAGNISRGGGLLGIFRILRSTVANNSTDGTGGGLHTISSVVINSTFIGNEASEGGGIFYGSATGQSSQVFSSTFAGNTASDTGGGINRGGNSDLSIANTVLAGNTATIAGPNCAGSITSQGYNLVQNSSGCGLTANGNDKINLAASLGSVANNGGLTAGSSLGIISAMQTHSPLPTSPLVDAGNGAGCRDEDNVVLATDQVGRDRAIDGPDFDTNVACDIGAIEYTHLLFEDGFE
jgi:CSLREA domain-containing protein